MNSLRLSFSPRMKQGCLVCFWFQIHSTTRDMCYLLNRHIGLKVCHLRVTFSVISEVHLNHLVYVWLIGHPAELIKVQKRVSSVYQTLCLFRVSINLKNYSMVPGMRPLNIMVSYLYLKRQNELNIIDVKRGSK